MKRRQVDVLMLGAGPAAATLGVLLRRLGLEVAVIGRPRPFEALEGLSERAMSALRQAGFIATAADLPPPSQRQAEWNGRLYGGNRERVVRRSRLDAALLAEAAAAGVEVIEARVGAVRRLDGQGGWRWVAEADGGRALRAHFLVESRGRSAPLGGVAEARGPASTALGRLYAVPAEVPAGGGIRSLEPGWLWWACDGAGLGSLQLVLGHGDGRLPGGAALTRCFERLSAAAELPWAASEQALTPVRGRAATLVLAPNPIGADRARLGDAAAAVDPLSGHGIYQALRGAYALAPCINTLLRRPADAGLARRFYCEHVAESFWRMARVGRDFYAAELRFRTEDFWRQRAAWPAQLPADQQATGAWRVERGPVAVDGFIESRELLRGGDSPRGVWQVGGVELAELARRLHRGEVTDTATPGARAALAWLRQHPAIGGAGW